MGGLTIEALERRDDRVLDHLVGEVEVAEETDQGRGQSSTLLTDDTLERFDR
jgi:hypothetical protein